METNMNKYITVAYRLYVEVDGKEELQEEATAEHPFQFISGMGTTLDAFEAQVADKNAGEEFDFVLTVDEAYGPFEQEHVITLDKSVFEIDGRFDGEHIYPGSVVPLLNADGARFNGTIQEVTDDKVIVDLNHPLAGKALYFKGSVVTSREATKDEIQGMLNMLSGEGGCGCGCDSCGGDCGCDHDGDDCGCGHCH